jgi:hypothetical protein
MSPRSRIASPAAFFSAVSFSGLPPGTARGTMQTSRHHPILSITPDTITLRRTQVPDGVSHGSTWIGGDFWSRRWSVRLFLSFRTVPFPSEPGEITCDVSLQAWNSRDVSRETLSGAVLKRAPAPRV